MAGTINRSTAGANSMTTSATGRGPRRVAGLVAIAALGLGLLGVLVLSHARPDAQPSESSGVGVNSSWVYTAYHPATGPDGQGCVAASAAGVPGEGCNTVPLSLPNTVFISDQFTYREDHRGER